MLSVYCYGCDNKKSRFIKKTKAVGMMVSLRIKSPLSKTQLVSDIDLSTCQMVLLLRTSVGRSMLSIHCALYNLESNRFVKEQEEEFLPFFLDMNMVKRLVAHPGVMKNNVKTIFHKKIVDDFKKDKIFTPKYKNIKSINNIIDNIFLEGDKLMVEMHLKQPKFTYRACGPFSKIKNEYKQSILDIFIKMN